MFSCTQNNHSSQTVSTHLLHSMSVTSSLHLTGGTYRQIKQHDQCAGVLDCHNKWLTCSFRQWIMDFTGLMLQIYRQYLLWPPCVSCSVTHLLYTSVRCHRHLLCSEPTVLVLFWVLKGEFVSYTIDSVWTMKNISWASQTLQNHVLHNHNFSHWFW